MKILNIDCFLDGGTIIVETDNGSYFIDNRIKSTTKGYVFSSYPDSNDMVINQSEIKKELRDAISNYATTEVFFDFKQTAIDLLGGIE